MKSQMFYVLLISVITQILSKVPNDIKTIKFIDSFSKNYVIEGEQYFQILIISESLPKFLKVQINNYEEGKNPNFVVTFSKSLDTSGEREQMSTGEKSALMWLTQAQLQKENNLLYVSCYSFPCNFNLSLLSTDEIRMDFNSQFNLYVTDNNKDLEVTFTSEKEELDASYISLWAIGNKNPEVSLGGEYDSQPSSKDKIFKINQNTSISSTYVLKIKAEVNDVINIGSSTFDANQTSTLINNSPEKKGFIKKDFSNQEECYSINIDGYEQKEDYYISGIIHTKVVEIYYKNGDGEIIENTDSIINNGSFIHLINPSKENKKYICLRFPTNDIDKYDFDEIYYSIQLTDPKQSDSNINVYSPQIIGEIYPRMLKEEEIFIYKGIHLSDDANEISFEMISDFGLPDMYFDICTNYPLCNNYKYDNLDKLTNPIGINGQSSYKVRDINRYSPMDKNQYVMIVKCVKSNSQTRLPCGFKTVYNSNSGKISLKENELFSHYVKSGDSDLYKIDFSGQKNVEKIYVDLMIFTGDIIFNSIEKNLISRKLYNANKIFYSIILDQTLQNQELNFNVTGSKNSYYSIKYMLVGLNDDSWITNIIETGVSYLVTIDPEGKDSTGEIKPYKFVKFSNLKLIENIPFLVNFNSLNCKLNVTAKRFKSDGSYYYESIDSYDQYYQDVVFKNEQNDYEYMLTIDDTDLSVYNNKLCMVYASSLDINKEDLDERQIVISDNEPKQIVFKNNIQEIEYLYPHSNRNNDVIIKFNFLDIAKYDVEVSYGDPKVESFTQQGSELIYIHHHQWENATTNDVLPIIIKNKKKEIYVEDEPKLIISVMAVQENTPSYIKKNNVQIDFLLGNNSHYYYTDLGKGEEGNVIVNYRRGSGRLFGKIVKKNVDKPEEGANWREMYKFPETVEESLEFNGYVKKIMIRKEETEKCEDGCYLLLTLRSSIIPDEIYDFREHPFSIKIFTKTPVTGKDTEPIINIPLNEYILGNINISEGKSISEFYTTYFTHDSDSILIDFQSKVVNFNIKVGLNNKPSITDKDFNFSSFGDDTIFKITKEEFLSKCKERGIDIPKENSLFGLGMTIGIWTDKIDSFYTTVYSMKVNLPYHEKNDEIKLNIIEVQSDQKTLCKPTLLPDGESYRCLYMIFYSGLDPINHLLIYPEIQEYSPYKMYADFVIKDRYHFYDYTYLYRQIPKEDSAYTTDKSNTEYLYIEHPVRYNNYLYLNIISKNDSIIELYTSFYTNDIQLSPNPSSPQLFLIKNKFQFEFTTEEDLLVTIKSICGQGKIKWDSDEGVEYYITGKDKVISLPSSLKDKSDPKKVFSNLNVELIQKENNCPGFAFHISYLLRPSQINLDEIPLGKSTNMDYRDTDLPVYVYTEIFYLEKDVHAFIKINELVGKMEGGLQNIPPFELSAALVNDTVIMNAKLDKNVIEGLNFEYKGVYDPMIKTGFVLITKEEIKKKNLQIADGPSVILKISKNMNYPKMKDTNFIRVSIETSIIQDNTEIPAIPGVYQYGKLSLSSVKNIYRLKTNRAEKYMRIHFSSGSDKINYVIGISNETTSTFSFAGYEDSNVHGKQVITFDSNPSTYTYIYLIVMHQADKASTDRITNYAFKYMTAGEKNQFIEYKLDSDQGFELDKKKDGDNYVYNFKLTPLSYPNTEITYFIKFVAKSDWIENEKDNSIALKESKSYVEEFTNYKIESEKIVKKYTIKEIDYRYVQVIAMVKSKDNYEFVGYGSYYEKDAIWWKILLIILAAVIVGVVIFYSIRFYLKRKRDIGRQMAGIEEGPMISKITEHSVA